jgi:hypothetical protein
MNWKAGQAIEKTDGMVMMGSSAYEREFAARQLPCFSRQEKDVGITDLIALITNQD